MILKLGYCTVAPKTKKNVFSGALGLASGDFKRFETG